MSKRTEKTGKDELDPQSLFEQFEPTRLFENPEPSLKDGWFTVAKVVVPVAREAFWHTIVRLFLRIYIFKSLMFWALARGAGRLNHSLLSLL
jgi:hypothetical protein